MSRERKSRILTIISECPKCGEKLSINISKKQVKEMWKGFKRGIKK